MKKLKKALSILLVFTCLLQVCSVSGLALAETSISTSSLEGIKENNDTNWEYVLINGTTEIDMVYGLYGGQYPGMIISSDKYVNANDQYARFLTNGGSHPAYSGDTASVYKVQEAGRLDLTLKVTVTNAASNGVQVKIYKNSNEQILQAATVVTNASGAKTFTVKGVSVEVGDRIYFALNMNGALSSDGGTFEAIVETAQVEETIDTKSTDGIVADNQTNWSYVSIKDGVETPMKWSTTKQGLYIDESATNGTQYAKLMPNGASCTAYNNGEDIAAIYNVQQAGYLECAVTAALSNALGNGVNVKIWVNSKTDYLLVPTKVVNADGRITYTVPSVSVQKGDKIYFGLDNNGAQGNDGGIFLATVKSAEKLELNKAYSGDILASQADYGYSYYHISDDFVETAMTYGVSASAYMNGHSGKSYTTTKDATAFFNDKYQACSARAGYTARVYTVPRDGKISVKYSVRPNAAANYQGDGVSIAMALNDYAMGGLDGWSYLSKDEWGANTTKTIEKEIYAQAGDKIYFLLSKNGGAEGTYVSSYDLVLLNTSVTYAEFSDVSDVQHTVGSQELILPVAGKTYGSHTTIAENPKGNFSYVRIDKNTNTLHPLVYDNGQMRVTKSTDSLDYYGCFGNNYYGAAAANCDIAVVYTAPVKMNVNVQAHGKFAKDGLGDGVNVYFYKNNFNFKIGEGFFEPAGDLIYHTVENVTLEKGDRVFIVLNNNGTNSYDGGSFAAKIVCNSVNPSTEVTVPENPGHKGSIMEDKIYLTATTVGDLIDSFTDESFVNVKADGEYLTRYATIKTGDTVVIDGRDYTAIISGDGNANGKVDRNANGGDLQRLREKLVGNELTELETLAYQDDTDVKALVRRMKQVKQYSNMSFAPITLHTTDEFTITSDKTTTNTFEINRTASEFGTVRICLDNNSNTNYGKLFYKTGDSESYNEVPFYFEEGEGTVSIPLTNSTLFHGVIESMYITIPGITTGSIKGTVKVVSEAQYGGNGLVYCVSSQYLQDGAVYQAGKDTVVWGTAACDMQVKAELYDSNGVLIGTDKVTVAESELGVNEWELTLPAQEASYSKYSIKVYANDALVSECSDILFGEVWLASGQSNMQLALKDTFEGDEHVANANDEYLRVYRTVDKPEGNGARNTEATDVKGTWYVANEEGIGYVSAISYHFATELRKELDVPVAVLQSACGSTPIEAWITKDMVDTNAALKSAMQSYGTYKETATAFTDLGAMYNSKIAPLTHANIKGVLWYQGETSVKRADIYAEQLDLLKEEWGKQFGFEDDTMPLIFTQIAPYIYINDKDTNQSYFTGMMDAMKEFYNRNSDTTSMLSIYDVSLRYEDHVLPQAIHTTVKKPVGARFALGAMGLAYNKAEATAPILKSHEIKDGKVILTFEHTGTGLQIVNQESDDVLGFAVCGENGIWVNATAQITGTNTVEVYSDFVTAPLYVSYAYCDMNTDANLCASNGIPAAPFTTGGTYGFGSRSYLNCDEDLFVATGLTGGGSGEYQNLWTVKNRVTSVSYDADNRAQGMASVKGVYEVGSDEVLVGMDLTDASTYSITAGLAGIDKLSVKMKNGDAREKSVRLALTTSDGTVAYTEAQNLASEADFAKLVFDLTTLYDAEGQAITDAQTVCSSMRKLTFCITDTEAGTVWIDDIKLGY